MHIKTYSNKQVEIPTWSSCQIKNIVMKLGRDINNNYAIVVLVFPHVVPVTPPQSVATQTLNSTALNITWAPPNVTMINGILTAYTIRITEVETGEMMQIVRDRQDTELTVASLHPDYWYSVDMSCNTSVGEGPFSAPRRTRLAEDGNYVNTHQCYHCYFFKDATKMHKHYQYSLLKTIARQSMD